MIGQAIAHFRITEKLGAGGMGEVYRATDSRLGREVALKILPQSVATDAERMARFEREAQLLAALNHPHIATIFGLELWGATRALIMELVEGPTLAQRIAKGPLSLEEALPIARQMAEALEFAHERGIIHRDLKPANVKLTPAGAVKLLDFGLAKALDDSPAAEPISNSPTLSAAATKAGIILGTAAYMSPEQAKGKAVDRRADIWAFGVVFYEMLSGKALYTGETAPETLAHVITKDPTWAELPSSTPPSIRRLLERCLTKDPKQRLRDIGEARIAIEDSLAHPADDASAASQGSAAAAVVQPLSRRVLPWAMAGLFGVATLALLALWRPWQLPPLAAPIRVSAELGTDATLFTTYGSSEVLSPDAARIVFAAVGPGGKQQLFVRSLDQLQATPLSGTEGARDPFFSPDGQWIAFFADGKLKKISVQGGAAVAICDAADDRGGSWSEDGTILFAPTANVSLSKVSAAGGLPQPLTTLDRQAAELSHRWPQVLAGGNAVLFTSGATSGNLEDADIVIQVLPTGQKKTLYRGGFYARYLPSGHLVFLHEGTMFAVPFDLKRLEVAGQAAPVLEGVTNNPGNAGAQFSFSDTGTLVYLSGTSAARDVSVYWMGRDARMQPLRETPGPYYALDFSPDGKRLALDSAVGRRFDVWTYDWRRDTLTRLTFSGESNSRPIWTPDGQRITYVSVEKDGTYTLSMKRADGAGDAQRLLESKFMLRPGSWRPDGKVLAYFQLNPQTGFDIYTLNLEGDEKSGWKPGEPKPFVNTPFGEVLPAFSPDGRWLAYGSNESGRYEVYVRPFPGPGGKWQISTGGGYRVRWSRAAKEIFFESLDNKIMVATYTASGDSFQAGKPSLWSDTQILDRGPGMNFALDPDGKRLAVFKAPGTEAQPPANKVTIIFNFFDELRRKLSAK